MGTNKAAIYCRLSEEDRDKRLSSDDSGSIQNQKAMLVQYAAEQGWEVYRIYSDDDYAGSDRSRPAFQQLLQMLEPGGSILSCAKPSPALRESWSWWKSTFMDCFLSGASALSAL